jgi:hypothetical protein
MKLTKKYPPSLLLRRKTLFGGILAAACLMVPACFHAEAQSYTLSNTFALAGITNNLDASANNRGMCYYFPSNMVIVVNKGTHYIATYDGTTGISNNAVTTNGVISGPNFLVNKVGTASDGVLYGASLTTSLGANLYNVYRWTNITMPPTFAYESASGDPLVANMPGKRIGDTFAITGGGTNTMILASMGGTNAYALLSTTNGINFTPTVITIPGSEFPSPTPSGVQFGFAFYTNNTFVVNPNDGKNNLYLIQFPTNFASLTSPVAATVLATNSGVISGIYLDMSYDGNSGLFATHANAYESIDLFSLPSTNFAGLTLLGTTNLSFLTSTGTNGNETGDIALGGVGFTNMIYTLDTSAGLQATAIDFAAAAVAPSITAEPTGGTTYTNIGTFTFSVSATGTQPLLYQWQFNTVSNATTASNISGATNATYTLGAVSVSNSGWYDVVIQNAGGSATSTPTQLIVYAPVGSTNFTNIWSLAPGSRPYLGGDGTYDTRGMAFDTNTMTVLLADKNGSETGIFVISATNGTDLFALNTVGVGVTGDQFPLDQVGVGDDGVVYACNLYDTGGTVDTFAIFSWSSVSSNAVPQFAYGPGDPSAPGIQDRWGDTMAVRGAGVNTEILLGSYAGFESGPSTNAALLTTLDGSTFTSIPLIVTNVGGITNGFCSLGICFGKGNTFWAKSPAYDLYEIGFDPGTGNCNILLDIPSGTSGNSSFNSMSAICVDTVNNLLTGITFNDVPNDLAVYQLYGSPSAPLGIPPYLVDQAFFPSNIGNSQDNGVTTIKGGYIFGLDINNGLTALAYTPPAAAALPSFSITSITNEPGTGIVITYPSYPTVDYQLQYTTALQETNTVWTNIGSPVTATSTTTSVTNTSPSDVARFYRLVIP